MKKHWSFLMVLILVMRSSFSLAQDSENRQLWLITAKISHSSTFQLDTSSSFSAGDQKWESESHQSAKTTASGTIMAVVENQAENPAKDFLYHSDAGDPVSITVTGQGSMTESSNSRETIDGVVTSERLRTDNASGTAYPGASLYFEYSDETKSFDASLSIKAVGSYQGRMYSGGRGFGEWTDYQEEIKNYGISCGGGGDAMTDKSCKMTKTGRGFQGSWKESESKQHHTASGPEYRTSETTVEITVEPYKESDKPEVTLLGCSELEVGGQSMVAATGKPLGGTFRFWAEPSSMMTVETDGSSANLTGASPEKGTLYVEYTTPDGKTAQSSQTASCVKVESYNGGQAIPQIALYDIDGKKLSGIKTVPVDAQPANAAELVKFVPADPGVLTAVGVGSEVTLQAVRTGTTTLQAKTNCNEPTGPAVEVEVVNCDEETIATLERMKEAAMENLVEATERLQKAAGSEEFEKARDELVEATAELLAKSALTIIGSGHVQGSEVVHTAIEVAEAGESVSEMVGSATHEQFNEKAFEGALKAVGSSATKALVGAVGVHEAARKFGEIVGEIYKHEKNMEDLDKSYEKAFKDLEKIQRRLQFCKNENEQPQAQTQTTKTDPAPQPKKPTPKTTEPPKQKTQTTASTTDEPATGDDDGVIGDPEPPSQPPRQVGLPYSAQNCGCNQSKNLTANSAGLSELGAGIKNLGDCVEDFRSKPVNDYELALKDLSALSDSLTTSLTNNPEAFKVKAKESKPRLDELTKRVKAYDKAGNDFLKKMNKCPESVTTGMEIFQSVEKITVDDIKTHY